MNLDTDLVSNIRINLSAIERRTSTLTKRRSVKKEYQAAWLLKAISLIDLTTLSGDDTAGKVERLCEKAKRPISIDLHKLLNLKQGDIQVGAVCQLLLVIRRPQLHHDHPLQPVKRSDNLLIQATGKVVALIREPLSDQSIDGLVEIALEHNMKSLTLRLNMDPADQPKWQGSLDRQLSRRHGERDGFVAQHPSGDVLLLCVCHSES